MPELHDAFAHLADLDLASIHARIEELKAPWASDFERMPDDDLAELLFLNRLLRKKVAASGGGAKKRNGTAAKQPATLDDLA